MLAFGFILQSCSTIRISKQDLLEIAAQCGEAHTLTMADSNNVRYDMRKKIIPSRNFDSTLLEKIKKYKVYAYYDYFPFGKIYATNQRTGEKLEFSHDRNSEFIINEKQLNEVRMYIGNSAMITNDYLVGYRSRILGIKRYVSIDSINTVGLYTENLFDRHPIYAIQSEYFVDDTAKSIYNEITKSDSVLVYFYSPMCGSDTSCLIVKEKCDAYAHVIKYSLSKPSEVMELAAIITNASYYGKTTSIICGTVRKSAKIDIYVNGKVKSIIFPRSRNSVKIHEQYYFVKENLVSKIFVQFADNNRKYESWDSDLEQSN